jgi:hypothetical protein
MGTRSCLTCSRERARTQANLIRDARKVLDLSHSEYVSKYGRSSNTAKAILASREAW